MLNPAVVYEINQVLGLDKHTELLINAARSLLSGEHSPKRRKILGDLLSNLKDNSEVESREEDKDWFEGKWKLNDFSSRLLKAVIYLHY